MPKRVRLQRTRGWRIPDGAVKVDRSTVYGNPYKSGATVRNDAHAVDLFTREIESASWGRLDFDRSDLIRLRGRDLACWCGLCERHRDGKPFDEACSDCAPCHADVLGEIANRPIRSAP